MTDVKDKPVTRIETAYVATNVALMVWPVTYYVLQGDWTLLLWPLSVLTALGGFAFMARERDRWKATAEVALDGVPAVAGRHRHDYDPAADKRLVKS